MQQILNTSLPYTPGLLLLGDLKYKQSTKCANLLANVSAAATQLIAGNQKKDASLYGWLYKVKHTFLLRFLL